MLLLGLTVPTWNFSAKVQASEVGHESQLDIQNAYQFLLMH